VRAAKAVRWPSKAYKRAGMARRSGYRPVSFPPYAPAAALLLFLVLIVPSRAIGRDCTKPTDLPRSESGQPRNISGLKSELLYYQCSGAYEREFHRVIDKAISYLNARVKKGGKLALVLDIDETSLSNWEEMKVNDFGLIEDGPCELAARDADGWRIPLPNKPCGFGAWILSADAKPLDTLRLFKAAKESNVAIFFVTGRKDDEDHKVLNATAENLHKAGYSTWTELMLEPGDFTGTVQEFKTARRKEIEAKAYTIIANVGDQYSDLKGGYSERMFKLPNPFYFVP
jgi:hypothetical protein